MKSLFKSLVLLAFCQLVVACASTSSVVVGNMSKETPRVAMVKLEGELGSQAVDFLTEEFIRAGIAVVESARTRQVIAIDTDLADGSPSSVQALNRYGEQLGVSFLFVGTVETDRGPLSSYPHVFITLRLIDVKSGQSRWIGRYGNPMWSSAISTQGDLQQGAKRLVKEFSNAGGKAIIHGKGD